MQMADEYKRIFTDEQLAALKPYEQLLKRAAIDGANFYPGMAAIEAVHGIWKQVCKVSARPPYTCGECQFRLFRDCGTCYFDDLRAIAKKNHRKFEIK